MTGRRPAVSVIMPVFNGERFLTESIESVLGQSFQDWELLVVDDGSADRSPEIARGYASERPDKVRYLEHEGHVNRGATTSRNLALRAARGAYFAFLDADDVWLPAKLGDQVALLAAEPHADVIYGAPCYWTSWAAEPMTGRADTIVTPDSACYRLVRPPTLILANHPLGPGSAPCPSDLLVRRELVERVGGFEEEFQGELQLYEDQAFLAKLYLGGAVYASSRCWLKYRLHEDSCDARVHRTGRERHARLYYLEWLRRYLDGREVAIPEVTRALDRALWRARHPLLHRAARRVLGAFNPPS
jgi:glycosyltransferase involved in cell wall biosynthesis